MPPVLLPQALEPKLTMGFRLGYLVRMLKFSSVEIPFLIAEASPTAAAVGEASAIKNGISTEENFNILTKYPSLNPIVSLGSSAWGSNTGGTNLGQAFGLALGDVSFFTPILQEKSSSLLYSYSTGSSNFDGSWGASSEVGYTWYDPNNQSSNNILIGYDGWNTQGCFHSQIAIGGKIERNHWQFSTNGGIATDNCEDSLSFATAKIGIPIVNLGEQSIHLTLANVR